MYKLAALLVLVLPAFGAQSVTVTSTCSTSPFACPALSLPNSAPWTTMGTADIRVEGRIHNIGSAPWLTLGAMNVIVGSGTLQINNVSNPPVTDTLGAQTGSIICCSGHTDVTIRLERKYAARQYLLTMCDTSGGTCQSATWAISALGFTSWATFPISINADGNDIAWLRWYSTLAPDGSVIRNIGTGDVADWEFESSLVDSVHSLTFGGAGVTVSYSTTPTFAPSCDAGIQQTFSVGIPGSLDGTNSQPLDNGSTLTALWTYAGIGADGVTQGSLSLGAATSLTSSLSGYTKGSVNMTLTVTDGSMQSTSCTIHDGAVVADANDIVSTGLPQEDLILGPLLRYGSPDNRAPPFDYWNKLSLDTQGAALSTQFPDYWDTPSAGTVDISQTSACGSGMAGFGLVGHSTHFTTDTAPGNYIVIYWGSGGAYREMNIVNSVASDTCLQLQYTWAQSTTESGQHYVGAPDQTVVGRWGISMGTSTPGNYYDNVKAYKSFYRRSGIDTYWSYYSYLAPLWWHLPQIDQGQTYNAGALENFIWPRRSLSLEGLFLYAMDPGNSGMWPGLEIIAASNETYLNTLAATGWQGNDEREIAYAQLFIAEEALLDPNSTPASTARTNLSTNMPFFTSDLQADGSFPTAADTIFDTTHQVTVTQGSPTVTCSTCNFTGMFPTSGCLTTGSCAPFFATFTGSTVPTTNAPFSSVYRPTVTNSTTLTLDRNYTETGGTYFWARDYDCVCAPEIGPLGWYIQPFMEAIQVTAFVMTGKALATSDPTNAALANTYAQDAATNLMTYGYGDPAHSGLGGMTAFALAVNCSYPVQTSSCVNTTDASEQRTQSAESIRALSQTYALAPSPTKLAFLRTLFDAMYCKPGAGGTCTSDGSYIHQLDDPGGYIINAGVGYKWTGFFFGYSANINAAAEAMLVPSSPPGFHGGVPHGIVLH